MTLLAGDKIYAEPYSVVGSVGVILKKWDVRQTLQNWGVKVHFIESEMYLAFL